VDFRRPRADQLLASPAGDPHHGLRDIA
jgi:hypothetical protein